MIEEWRPTYHGNYDVSNLGRVRSRAPQGPAKTGMLRLMTPSIANNGYLVVTFGPGYGFTKKKRHLVHRLVAAAFIGPCPDEQECRHKDDDRANARLDNIEYGTHQQNVQDCIDRGRTNRAVGERAGLSKLTTADVLNIRSLTPFLYDGEIAALFGTAPTNVWAIRTRFTWRHV